MILFLPNVALRSQFAFYTNKEINKNKQEYSWVFHKFRSVCPVSQR